MKVLASAPGKVILFGEHGVVYGKPAVAVAIDLRTYGLFESRKDGKIKLNLPDISVDAEWDDKDLRETAGSLVPTNIEEGTPIPPELHTKLENLLPDSLQRPTQLHATLAFLYLYLCLSPVGSGLDVTIRSGIPVGAGLGSSASYAVVLSSGLLKLIGKETKEIVNSWAFMAEKIIHGNPSGLDNTLCTYGGAKLYSRLDPIPKDVEGFKSLEILVTNTRVPKNTMKQVADVRIKKDWMPGIVDPMIDAVGSVAGECCAIFKESLASGKVDQGKLSYLVDANHGLLVALGTSHPALEKVRELTGKYGLSSKLTGGGGGGCAITFVRDDISDTEVSKAESELRQQGFDTFRTSVGGPGFSAVETSSISEQDVASLDLAKLSAH